MGDGLAHGYVNEPALTSRHFVDLPGTNGVPRRGYRSGDWVVEMPDGDLDFLGRRDEQVQIDGSRIEPLEVEAVVAGLSEVAECRVRTFSGPFGQVRLAAYVVLCEGGSLDRLHQAMRSVLPVYMIPHQVVSMSALPLNANGKLATESLPSPWPRKRAAATRSGESEYLSLAEQAWAEVLGFLPESADVNFFDAGGRSLEAVMLHDLLERRLGFMLEPTFVFEFSTARRQASELSVLLAKSTVLPPGLSSGAKPICDS